LPLLLLSAAVLPGCNDAPQAAPGKDSPSLRIVMRMHPDPAQMRSQLEARMASCQLALRAQGSQAAAPPLPSPADIAKWVTRETEELYANGRRAAYSTDAVVWPDAAKGCQWTFYKTVHAETEALCADWYAGSAKADPNPDARREPPRFSEEKTTSDDAKRCLTKAAKTGSASGLPKGATTAGQPCLWLSDDAAGGEPKAPGQHFCAHPRAYDGSLPRYSRGSGPTLRYLRVLPPGAPPSTTPETDANRMEAEVVEEGKPIADARFGRQAVEAFVKQPLVVPVGGQQ
jgi:hypothetical protein